MKLKYIFAPAALLLSVATMAQTQIGFETEDYQAIGVYDTWEASPFRTGTLQGNVGITANPFTNVEEVLGIQPNPSEKVLAVQRSRFGSNTFGARIDLKETFELTPETQYLHVMVHRPYHGRIMVVGLGKRQDRAGQSPETEQFWAMSTINVEGNRWQDVVLPIKGNGGIDIYSLVVVPDCESPHAYTEDAICYIDNIEINDVPQAKFSYAYYPISFNKTQTYTRSDRHLNTISLQSSDGQQTATLPTSPNTVFNYVTNTEFQAKAGEQVTATFNYSGNWMHGYVYLDRDNDGKFSFTLNEDSSIPEGSDVMAFSFVGVTGDAGKNSVGTSLTGANRNVINPPAFTLPANLENGYYRLRFKVDWNCIDPAGNLSASNPILGNGGAIADIRLNIHGDYCNVNDANRNGEVLTANGEKLVKYQAPFGEPFTIKMNPEQGFEYAGIIVKHGYNLSGDSLVRDNLQWERVRISREKFNENHEYTIPAELMNGDVEIEGLFIEEGTYVPEPIPTRYATTTVVNGEFADNTPWYTLQIGQQGYVLADNKRATSIALNVTTIDPYDATHFWCFTGNEEEGYRIYNMNSGAAKVLAAPIEMKGSTGADSHPTLQPVDNLPTGYTDLWMFQDSPNLNVNDVAYAYMYEKGYPSNKVNNRNNKLAFWNTGQDAGSTLRIFPAENILVKIGEVPLPDEATPVIYDLQGRRVKKASHGLYIIGGNKRLIK